MVRDIPLSDGLVLLEGELTDINLKTMVITPPDEQPIALNFHTAARKTDLPSFVDACQRYLSNNQQLQFACLVRNTTVLCIWPLDTVFELPESFGGRIFPGLGAIPIPPYPNNYALSDHTNEAIISQHRGPNDIIDPWLTRLVFGGAQAIHRRQRELHADIATLNDSAAPLAAQLLTNYGNQPQAFTTALALAVYAHNL